MLNELELSFNMKPEKADGKSPLSEFLGEI